MLSLWWMIRTASAHGGAVPTRGVYDWSHLPDLEPGAWIVWEFYPSIILGCLAVLGWYAMMAGPLRQRYGWSDRGPELKEWLTFIGGLLVVFFALQGPMHELSDVYLFSGHMVQHLSITLLFPPLFILGMPGWMVDAVARLPGVAAFGNAVTRPLPAILIPMGTLYVWHMPGMYNWALIDHNVHVVEHLSFMATAVWMWWPAWSRSSLIPRMTPGWRMVYLFLLTLPMKALGAVITVSDTLLYDYYSGQPRVFGLDPMSDQRLGGLIMWVPGGLVFWGSIAFIFFGSYYQLVAEARRGPQRGLVTDPLMG